MNDFFQSSFIAVSLLSNLEVFELSNDTKDSKID